MQKTTNSARGEAAITIGTASYPLRFGLNVMRDLTALTGKGPSEFGAALSENYAAALTDIVYCAVKRAVPADALAPNFSQDDAADLIDRLPAEEADAIADAITEAVTVGSPLMAALTARVAAKNRAAQSAHLSNGTSTSTSDLAS